MPASMPPLKLQPISPQSVQVGKTLSVTATVKNAEEWKGKLRYSLKSDADLPPAAKIDPATGAFAWRSPRDHAAGTEDVSVTVETPDGQKDQTRFTITVTRPPPVRRKSPLILATA